MSVITITSILVTFCAFFAYFNYRFIKLPTTIGIMVMALVMSAIIIILPHMGVDNILPLARDLMGRINFSEALIHGMLSFLLFAGALHVDWKTLHFHKAIVFTMAFGGTLFSTFAVGGIVYYVFPYLGIQISFIHALLFGALISPTDPIAVMAILKKAGVPQSLEIKVVGESLLNDGVAVVIFLTILGIVNSGHFEPIHVAKLFAEEAVGGVILGSILGYIAFVLLRSVDNYQVEIFLTLALVMGGYELADYLHTSGPIAIVVAGLIVGNIGRELAMSDQTKENLDNFWELVDEFLNAVLFMLIGLELLQIPFDPHAFHAGLFMIPALLSVRYLTVFVPIKIMSRFRRFTPGAVNILTWGGLRGGLSVALVLSLPMSETREVLLLVTYCIVMFSIIVQGLTIGRMARRYSTEA